MNKLLGSSIDPKQLSLTIKGGLTLIVPLVALLVKSGGGQIGNEELQGIIDMVADFVFFSGSLLALLASLYGAIRKIAHSF